MKKIVIAISLSIIPVFSVGAGQLAYAQEHSHHASEAGISGLGLNHGQQWEMDEHTRTMLVKMEATFFAADHSSQVGLNAAGAELKVQLDELIAGCTMAGEAHDQLHVFMSEYIPVINLLAQAGDHAIARDAAIELKGHFGTYKKYFR